MRRQLRSGRRLDQSARLEPSSAAPAAPGGSSGPAGAVSVSAASANPCLLVNQAEASAILKASVAPPTSGTLGTFNGCTYTSGGTIVIVAIAPVPLTPAGEVVISNPSPSDQR